MIYKCSRRLLNGITSSIALLTLLAAAGLAQAPLKPRFAIYREHDSLVIRDIRNVPVVGGGGCELLTYRVDPLTTKLTLWRGTNNSASRPITTAAEIRISNFFQASPLSAGAAVLVPHASVSDVVAATDRNGATLSDLIALFDGRRIYSYDMTRLRPAPGHAKVHNRWDGKDLVVEATTPTPGAVIVTFLHQGGASSATGGTMQVLRSSNGEVIAPATANIRYLGANSGSAEAESIIVDRSTAELLRPVLSLGGSLPYAGLDVLIRSGAVYAADIARQNAPATTAPGNALTQLREIRRRVPDAVAKAKSADEVTSGVIRSYDDFTTAIPPGILKEPRVWEQVNQTFLDELAWDVFFKYVSFANSFGRLEFIRSQLDLHDPTRNIGEEFIFSFADRFLRRYGPDRVPLDARLKIAEQYFRLAPQTVTFRGTSLTVDPVIAAYYQLVGRFLASDVANAIEHRQTDSQRRLSDADYVAYGKRLAAMEVYLPERTSTGKKLVGYITRGEWDKIIQRANDALLSKPGRARDFVTATYNVHSPRTTAGNQIVFYDVSYSLGGQTKPLGHLILIQPNAHLHYGYTVKKGETGYTAADLQHRFGSSRYYVITTGSYSEATGRTSGLSAENGVVKNFHVTHKMDGFVAFRHGNVDVFDLENGFKLPGQTQVIRPIQSLRDFHTFVTWLRSEEVSGFQTHLLVKNDQSAIEPDKTSTNRRERRFLLHMRDARGRRVVAFLDVPNNEAINFIEAPVIIRRLMHDSYHYSVESAVNLDTGSYDILTVQSDGGAPVFKTGIDIDKATNLVVVYE